MTKHYLAALLTVAGILAPVAAQADIFDEMYGLKGKKLAKAIAKAEAFPLGSDKNPIRVTMPEGEHFYLRSLRCSDGVAPAYNRVGNVGEGVFGSIVDLYEVRCEAGEPKVSEIYMDMYHG